MSGNSIPSGAKSIKFPIVFLKNNTLFVLLYDPIKSKISKLIDGSIT